MVVTSSVSTDRQEISPAAQRAKIDAFAAMYVLQLVDVIEETQSQVAGPPGLQSALGVLKDGSAAAHLVVKLDRLIRSVADLGRLVEEYFASGDCALLSVSENIDTRTAGGQRAGVGQPIRAGRNFRTDLGRSAA